MMKQIGMTLVVIALTACSETAASSAPVKVEAQRAALSTSFPANSLIIPMDAASQDFGTLKAFGLLDRLLRVSTPVNRIIKPGKAHQDIDFSAPVTNLRTGAALGTVAYRSSPLVIAAIDATPAVLALIDAYQTANPTVNVHKATAAFTADVARTLVAAPRIGALRTGNQAVIYGYLNAANLTDANGNTWGDASPGAISLAQLAGSNIGGALDGVLMSGGLPAFDQFTVVHYQPNGGDPSLDEMTRELRGWLSSSATTHAHLQCSSTLVFENNINGRFLTNLGLADVGGATDPVEVLQPESLYAQYAGALQIDPGDTKSFALNTGSTLWNNSSLLVQLQASTFGQRMNWLTGYTDGNTSKGKVSFLGGHSYSTSLPISTNARTNGVRLFLNGLFETPALFSTMQPVLTLTKSAPVTTNAATFTFTINYANAGPSAAYAASISDVLPAGTTFVSATSGGVNTSGTVKWVLGDLAPGASGTVSVTVAAAQGTYQNQAVLAFRVGVTPKTYASNVTTTVVDRTAPLSTITTATLNPTLLTSATFTLSANEPATFMCRLDAAVFAPCSSPITFNSLAEGSHTLRVQATDTAGNVELTPVSFTWVVDLTAPVITFTSRPSANTNATSAAIAFTVTGATSVQCRLNSGAFAACTSPVNLTSLADGNYQFDVRATDAAGNVSNASIQWEVDTLAPALAFTLTPGSPTNQTTATFAFNVSDAATVVCSNSGGPFVACTSPFTLSGLTDGAHSFTVRATDLAGNVATIIHNWVVNTVAPTVTVISGPANPTQATSASLSFTVSSPGTIASVQCQLNGGAFSACTSPVAFTSLSDGPYSFSVRATDGAGNVGSANYLWVVDTLSPVITLTSSPSNPSNSNSGTIAFTVSEPATLTCQVDGGAFVTCDSPFATGPLSDASHTVTVRAVDGAGNVGTRTVTWLVDTTPPSLAFTSTPSALTNVDTASLAFTVGGATTVECRLDTGSFAPCTSPLNLTSLADGSHTVTVRATDAATNVTTISHTWSVDTTPPTLAFTSTPPNPSGLTTANFDFTVSGATTVQCRLDSGSFDPCTSPVGLVGLTDGSHTFTVRATDAATNTATVGHTWVVDTMPPDITFTSFPSDPTNLTTASLAFVVTGAATVIECRLDAAAFAACSSPVTLTGLADGSHTFTVRAVDAVGNTQSASHTWTVDTAAPPLIFTTVPGNPTNQASAHFAFTVSEAVTVECRLGTAAFATCTSPVLFTGLVDGPYAFSVRAVDVAGNVATITHNWVVNTVAPTVTITSGPANPTRATTATFAFTVSNVVTIECRVNTGVFVPCTSPFTTNGLADGSYTFTVRATDAATNVGSADYLWVVDTTLPVVTLTTTPPLLSGVASGTVAFTVNEPAVTDCSLNGGAFASCSSPEVFGNLGQGTQSVVVRATDPAGNAGTSTATWNVDTVAPVITLTSTPASLIRVANVSLAFDVSEPATLECQLNTGAFASCSSPYLLTALADGSYAVTIRATDSTGNVGNTSFAWTVDTTAPVVTFTATPPTLSGTNGATLSFTVSESATTECSRNAGAFASCSSPLVLTGLGEGAQTLTVRATDPAGNVGSQSATWTVDTVGPVITFTAQPASLVNVTSATLAFTTNEPATLECQLDSAAFAPCASPSSVSALLDGSHTFTVRATDPTANTGTASVTWAVDTVAPVLAFTVTPAQTSNTTTASFEFTVAGTPATIECKLDNGAFAACTSPHALSGLGDGTHTFTVRGTDAATNAASISYTWSVDAALPDTTIPGRPASLVRATGATIDLASNEAGTFECSLDGALFTACSDPLILTSLADGLHVLLARAVDVAGNKDPTPALATWTVDTLAPRAPRLLEPIASATTGAFPRMGGLAEPGSVVTVSSAGQTVCTAITAADGTWSCTGTTAFAAGQQTVTALATDVAGNASPPSLPRTFTVDTGTPDTVVLTGPSGLVASTTADFTVAASQAGATFECSLDGAAFTPCTAAPGFTALTQGTHHFEVRAVVGAVRDGSPATRDWIVDTVAPAAPVVTAPAANATTTSTPVITGTAEAGSTVVVSIDGQPVCAAVADAAGAFSCSAPSALGAGIHSVTAIATDVAGNASPPSTAVNFTVDGTVLDTAIIAGPSGRVFSNTANFAFTASVLGATFECNLDGAAFTACVTPTSFGNLADGSHTLLVRALVGAAIDSTPASRTWTIDGTAPIAPVVVNPANNATVYTRTPRYSGTAEPLSTVRVSVDDAVACVAVADAAGAWFCTSPTELAAGAHHVAAVSVDAVGNVSATSNVNVFTVDIPTVTVAITSPANNTLTNDNTPTFSGTASPNATVTVFVDGVQVGTTTATAGGTWSFTPSTMLLDGTRVVTAQAEFMGYRSPVSEPLTLRIDTRPPVVTLTVSQADENTAPTVTFSADESPVTFTCSLDQGDFGPCQSPLDVSGLGDGNHVLVVRATDAAGNVGTTTKSYVVVAALVRRSDEFSARGGGCGCGSTAGSSVFAGLALFVLAALSRRRFRRGEA